MRYTHRSGMKAKNTAVRRVGLSMTIVAHVASNIGCRGWHRTQRSSTGIAGLSTNDWAVWCYRRKCDQAPRIDSLCETMFKLRAGPVAFSWL